MNLDVKKLEAVLLPQLQFIRDGYNFQGSEADRICEFEQSLFTEVLERVFVDLAELELFIEDFCSSYSSFDQNYLRSVKQQIPYAVQQCLF